MHKDAKIYVAGHRGLVGSAIVEQLKTAGYQQIVTRTHEQLDLCNQQAVEEFLSQEKPDYVFLAAAKVGGIHANDQYPAEFIYDNLVISTNVIHSAYQAGVSKLLFLGSTCIYPRLAPQPLKEEYLLSGPLEATNQWYAVAKIAGIKLCQAYRKQYGCDYIAAMPTNLYGPGDNFDLQNAHVLPALIRKFHEAKTHHESNVCLWGSGKPLREFCYIDDCARACVFLMDHYSSDEIINIGVGHDITIAELGNLVKEVVGFNGDIVYDTSKPDGTPRKLVDVSRISALGWHAEVELVDGIRRTYEWYQQHLA